MSTKGKHPHNRSDRLTGQLTFFVFTKNLVLFVERFSFIYFTTFHTYDVAGNEDVDEEDVKVLKASSTTTNISGSSSSTKTILGDFVELRR